MKNEQEQLEALQDIRKMMKDSSKFLSLSGLSGVIAGIYALIGAWLAHQLISEYVLTGNDYAYSATRYSALFMQIIFISGAVLFLSIATALYLSKIKAKKINQKLFDHTSINLFWSMAIPLFAGGVFCVALLMNDLVIMVSPAMLLFYGLALYHSSKYTMTDIKYLGCLEIALGLLAAFLPGHGLLFWAAGFGVLHIIYGSIVWFKYDRAQ